MAPPTGDPGAGGQDNDVSEAGDSIESNLSAPGLGVLSIGLLAALTYTNCIGQTVNHRILLSINPMATTL